MAKFNHIDVRGTKKVPSAFGNVFISADSISAAKTVTFPDGYLNGATPEPNLAFKVVFANGHNASNASSYLSLNGVVVVSNQNGTLAPLPIHEMTEGGSTVYKVLDANTALELYYTEDYDGNSHPAFVVVGNPLVLSSSTYSIYANGYDEIGWNELSKIETVVPQGTTIIPVTAQYDGFVYINASSSLQRYIQIDGVDVISLTTSDTLNLYTIYIKKGQTVSISGASSTTHYEVFANWYKKRSY